MYKVVAHYQDGRLIKGLTADFTPNKDRFTILLSEVSAGTPPWLVLMTDLKGLFFVKDLDGDLGHAKSNLFELTDLTPGRRIRIQFRDGETMNGVTQGYSPDRIGFFVVPADRKSNTERAYIITAATSQVSFL